MPRLQDQVAIVTGGAQGLGGAIARGIAAEGASVLIADIDLEGSRRNVRRIQAAGNTAVALRTDVSRREDLQAAVERAVREWGRLDILVNNAFDVSTAGTGGAVQVSEADWDAGMNVMVKAIYRAVKLAVPEMIKSGAGSIVNISSVHGLLTAPGFLVYETAKAAVIGMTRQMACEYGPDGIRVNSILPGHMVTERLQPMWDENPSGHAYFENQYPLRRLGTTEDIAQGAVFLCSEEASFITGHALVIDGGLSIQLQENFGVRQGRYMAEHPETRIP